MLGSSRLNEHYDPLEKKIVIELCALGFVSSLSGEFFGHRGHRLTLVSQADYAN